MRKPMGQADLSIAATTDTSLWLRFVRACPADAVRGLVPYRHYRITSVQAGRAAEDVGRINLRTASTRLTDTVIGHIGFEVAAAHRGRGYARLACLALAPHVRHFMPTALITCDPDNAASRRTIERLGARFLGEFAVPDDYRQYSPHACSKLHFRWTP
jgi:predicted acetyltransferase